MNLSIMKIQYKLGIMALGLVAFSSCEKHDPIDDHAAVGNYVPTVYWELGSTACKAGESFSFSGKYWTEEGYTPDHSEVWYSEIREQTSTASVKLAGTLLSYTKTVAEVDTVRIATLKASFPHSEAVWDGYEYVLNGQVPTSSTLSPLKWAPMEWNDLAVARFNEYFPAGFDSEFNAEVIEMLVKDSYYNALRKVFCDYYFSNEQVSAVNAEFGVELPLLPDTIVSKPDAATAAATYKSGLWYADTEKRVGYYYITIAEDGSDVINEISENEVTKDEGGNLVYAGDNTSRVYERYDSAPWVLCRYDDDQGAVVTVVRPEFIPAFAKLLDVITFDEWTANGTDGYAISFGRSYKLNTQFRVVDTAGNVGIAYDKHTVSIN